MSYDDYQRAQKMGLKAYKTAITHGTHPYLPVLDEILSHAEVEYEVHLGISDIPLNQVVGTSTFGRTRAFACNFMPLLGEGSEFSAKWAHLSTAQVEEGIHDAVKVYEYMNKYYVVEGNKRVSVLKYFNCPSILADVTRKVPKPSDDLENRIYYEYMDFYELTQINYIRFTKLGSFAKLLTAVGKTDTEIWTTEERMDFTYFYTGFAKIFGEKRGDKLRNVTAGDALLVFFTFYPYEDVMDTTNAQLKDMVDKIWPEIVLLGDEDSVELLMNPVQEKNIVGSVLNKIITPRKRRVAFVYDKEPVASDWIYGHELGRLHLVDVFGAALDTKTFIIDAADEFAEAKLGEICNAGYEIIFTVTPKLIKACLQAAIDHPEVIILNCALNSSYNTVRTYYTRMYEAKFLTGMIAGSMCINDKVGYVADYPLYGVAASINAFALGAKMVNPRVKVYLTWSSGKDYDPDRYFGEHDITYISAQDMITPKNDNRSFGLYELTEYGRKNLAMSIYDWGVFYERLINSIQKGSWKPEEAIENKALNYWWGLSAGVIDVICSQHLPAGTVKLVELMKQAISSDTFHPLSGPLIDQQGKVHYEESEIMKPEDIVRMDWLVENVEGKIPTIDDLKEEAKQVVLLRGLYSATADKGGNILP